MIASRVDARAIGAGAWTLISVRTSIVEELRSQLRPGEGYDSLLSRLLRPPRAPGTLPAGASVPAPRTAKPATPGRLCGSVRIIGGIERRCRRQQEGHDGDHVWWTYRGKRSTWKG